MSVQKTHGIFILQINSGPLSTQVLVTRKKFRDIAVINRNLNY